MLNFKEYLAESKQSLWSDALNSKPEKYGAGFVDLVKADFWFDTIGGEESVQLDKSNTKLLDILSGALGKEGLTDALYDADLINQFLNGEELPKQDRNKVLLGKPQIPKIKQFIYLSILLVKQM